PSGIDAPRLPATRRQRRLDAERVPRLRAPRRTVRPLRDADRPHPGRRPDDLVLSDVPAGSGGEELVESTVPVEPPERGVAADRLPVEEDLGDRPAARGVEHRLPEGGVVVERDLLVREPAGVEERFSDLAEDAKVLGIGLDPWPSLLQCI